MSGFWSLRRFVACSVLAASIASAGVVFGQSTQPAGQAPLPPGPTSIATINGREINSQFYYGILMQIDGMRIFEKVRDLALVQNECITNGIGIGDAGEPTAVADDFKKRFKDEFDRAWDSLNIQGLPEGKTLTDAEKQQIMSQVLAQRGGNLIEFKLSLETRAALRALAKGKVDVTDQDIQNQYDSEYGEVLHFRVFPVPDDAATQAKIREAVSKGTKPDEIADQLKLPSHPGTANIPRSLQGKDTSKFTQAAFLLKKGELSPATELPTQAGQPASKGMIYFEDSDPDRRGTTKLDKVRDDIKKKVFDAKQEQWMNNHLIMLRSAAAITINDPVLSAQYQAIAEAIKQQAAAAASQPGGTPAPAATVTPAPAAPAPAGGATPKLPSLPGSMPLLSNSKISQFQFKRASHRNLEVPVARLILSSAHSPEISLFRGCASSLTLRSFMAGGNTEPFSIDVSTRLRRLPPYLFARLNGLKAEKRRAGADVIDLGMGNPIDPSPEFVIDKLAEAAHDAQSPLLRFGRTLQPRAAKSLKYKRRCRTRSRPRSRLHHRLQGRLLPPHARAALGRRHRRRRGSRLPDSHVCRHLAAAAPRCQAGQ